MPTSSPTVPQPGQSNADVLDTRAAVWSGKPLLRQIYHRYYAEMVACLARREGSGARGQGSERAGEFGTILELGAGSGTFREFFDTRHPRAGQLITSDIIPTAHCDLAVDGLHLPFAEGTLDNLVMTDVLHHIRYPLAFFAEARRVLRPGGRIVMLEPYISPFSRIVFKLTHPEPVNTQTPLFPVAAGQACQLPSSGSFRAPSVSEGVEGGAMANGKWQMANPPPAFTTTGPFAANQATPTLLFFRDRHPFQDRFPQLRLLHRRRLSLLVYPLSGGFSGPQLLPTFLVPPAFLLERLLSPLAPLLAFRLLVVLEKQTG